MDPLGLVGSFFIDGSSGACFSIRAFGSSLIEVLIADKPHSKIRFYVSFEQSRKRKKNKADPVQWTWSTESRRNLNLEATRSPLMGYRRMANGQLRSNSATQRANPQI